MNRQQRPITDREFMAWLAAGPVDRGVGEVMTFVASTTAAQAGKDSWLLRVRLNGRFKEKVLGRYPEISLKDACELARQNRAQIERGVDVAAAKQVEKTLPLKVSSMQRLGDVWFAKYIQPHYKLVEVVARDRRKHINPVIGPVAPPGRAAGPHRPRVDAHRGRWRADRRQRRTALHDSEVPDGRPQPRDRTQPAGRLRPGGGWRRRRGVSS